jgi:probable phosphoglycerate mutase
VTVVHLVRHGETIWHDGNRYAGRSDIELTDRGISQARALAGWAAARPIAVVASSSLRRAVDTARPSAEQLGLELVTDDRLVEVDFGRAEGLTAHEVSARWPDSWRTFLAAPAKHPLPGGELGSAAATRYASALEDLVGGAPPDREVLVVAHRTAMRIWLCHALGIRLDEYRRSFPRVDNVDVITVDLAADGRCRLIAS